MTDFLRSYLTIGWVALLGVGLAVTPLTLGRWLRPKARSQSQKFETYESGAEPADQGWVQTNIRYYLFALLFVVFDVEIVFIVPWAVQVEGLGGFGLAEMLLFVAILALGLAYAWRKGILKWQ